MPYTEHELDEEQLCLGIVNDSNSRLMLKASIPLAGLLLPAVSRDNTGRT